MKQPLRWKAFAVLALVILAGGWSFVWRAFVDFLPIQIAAVLGYVVLAFCAGWLLGERSARRGSTRERMDGDVEGLIAPEVGEPRNSRALSDRRKRP